VKAGVLQVQGQSELHSETISKTKNKCSEVRIDGTYNEKWSPLAQVCRELPKCGFLNPEWIDPERPS
jgi:hypothetical protein